jgi:hypothetical protein
MAISSDLTDSDEWWMWFSSDGEGESDSPDDYDFVLNGNGQVFAKDFLLPGSKSIRQWLESL